ncbi:MAG: RIP metalloprotease RseP [Chloroflexi bacterium]|nr:RIP metalloprotease RseP [Chloroflexota bacterium]
MFVTIATFIFVLAVLVLVHELGHFVAAKAYGIRVLEFGFGYPPRIFGIRRGETVYSLNLLPLGGFVKLVGEEDPTDPRSLARRSPGVRVVVLGAGAFMNALLPLVLFAALFMVPQQTMVTDVVIMEVAAGSPAAMAGIQPGDAVLRIHNRSITNSLELRETIQSRLGAETDWVGWRGGETYTARVVPRFKPPEGQGAVGVVIADARVSVASVAPGSPAAAMGLQPGDAVLLVGETPIFYSEWLPVVLDDFRASDPGASVPVGVWRGGRVVELALPADSVAQGQGIPGLELAERPLERRSEPPWRAVPHAASHMGTVLAAFKNEVGRWIVGAAPPQVAGPVGIAQLTGEVARAGIIPLISFTALLSMNLAILNILPIPMLDGGRLMFVLLEVVRGGKRVPPQKEGFVHLVGFVVLLSLIVVVTYFDIARILRGESILP